MEVLWVFLQSLDLTYFDEVGIPPCCFTEPSFVKQAAVITGRADRLGTLVVGEKSNINCARAY